MYEEEMIAEFLGWEKDGDYYISPFEIFDPETEDFVPDIFLPAQFRFQSSWDWLMLIVEKIESSVFEVTIIGNSCVIKRVLRNKKIMIFDDNSDTKIKSVYNTCLKFIKVKDYDSKRV